MIEKTTQPARGRPSRGPRAASLPESTLLAGRRLGTYRVIRELGRGAMGTVYLAERRSGTRIALKVIHPHLLADEKLRKRFWREVEAGKRVRHPNVIATLGAGVSRGGAGKSIHYIVLEYVEGRTLRQIAGELTPGVPEALLRHLAQQIAAGLAAVHAARIVHRDLKPENVLVTRDHVVRIMDLGVARLADQATSLSMSGLFVGTPLYAAPEQFRAEGSKVGPAADLYALGMILHELATGRHPFAGRDARQIMYAQLQETPRPVREMNPQLSPLLGALIGVLLDKMPARRIDSAERLAGILAQGEASSWWAEEGLSRLPTLQGGRAVRVPVPRETAFVGRGTELERLQQAFDAACAGQGRVVVIEGEAGIGKTRLIDAFLASVADEEAHILYGSFPPAGGGDGLSRAAVAHFGEAHLETALAPYLRVTAGLVPGFAAFLRSEAPPSDSVVPTPNAIDAMFCHLARSLAAERPVVWVVEDLHFAGPSSWQIALAMAQAIEDQRVLLVVSLRGALPAAAREPLARLPHVERLGLDRLGADQVANLLREALGSFELALTEAESLIDRIASRCDGNPLFLIEMIRTLRARLSGPGVSAPVALETEVPAALRSLIEARLGGLSDADRQLLDCSAIQGFEFDPHLTARVLGLNPLAALQAFAIIERRSGVVRSSGSRFHFDHHLIQEVISSGVPPALAREYHRLMAEAALASCAPAQRSAAQVPGEVAVFVCDHALQGANPKLGLRFAPRAIDHLAARFANVEAIALIDRALATGEELPTAMRADLLRRQAARLLLLGRPDEARAPLERARDIAAATQDRRLMAVAMSDLGHALAMTARYHEAEATLEEALAMAREVGDRHGEAVASRRLGVVYYQQGRYASAEQQYESGLNLAREVGDRREESRTANNLGNVFLSLGRYAQARDLYTRHLALAREIGDRLSESNALSNLGVICATQGLHSEAIDYYEQVIPLAREMGDRNGECIATGNLGAVYTELGHLQKALDLHRRQVKLAREIRDRYSESIAMTNLASSLVILGRAEQAREQVEQALRLAREIGARRLQAEALTALSEVSRMAEGERKATIELALEGLAIERETGSPLSIARLAIRVGSLRWEDGEHDAARSLFAEAEQLASTHGSPAVTTLASAWLAAMGARDPSGVRFPDMPIPPMERAEIQLLLYRAGAGKTHLRESRRVLEEIASRLPDKEAADTFWNGNRVCRELARLEASSGRV